MVIQIDGLGHDVLTRALRRRIMPFTRRLLRKHGYVLIPTRTGVPASTPSFQARLLYGVRNPLPGFRWYEKATGRVRVMKNYADINSVRERLPESQGLMRGGAVYAAFFSGGAERAYFTPGQLSPGYLAGPVGIGDLPRLVLANLRSTARILGLSVYELGLELLDWLSALWRGAPRRGEGLFPFERVATNAVLREVSVLGALGELGRGTPAVFINLMGYDVMAHHRGPRSFSAMLALKALDTKMRRLWRAAGRAPRSYEFYILSDHGQTQTVPFERAAGRSLRQAIVEHELAAQVAEIGEARYRELVHSVSVLGHLRQLQALLPWPMGPLAGFLAHRIERRLPPAGADEAAGCAADLVVLPTSGLTHVYFRHHPGRPDLEEIERHHPGLVAHIVGLPGVRAAVGKLPGGAAIISSSGRLAVGEGVTVVGHDPLAGAGPTEAVARELAELIAQPESGDLVILAGKLERTRPFGRGPVYANFLDELGGHGGIEPPEQNTFLIAPAERAGLFPAHCSPSDLYRGLVRVRELPGPEAGPAPAAAAPPPG